ncbi:MAG: phosphotransferase [Nanoarchaeota archaeon]|nr:phosphotransferase [Nanoarchaeota archaeon]
MKDIFKARMGFSGNLTEISKLICTEYGLGRLIDSKVIPVGYEDFNFLLRTSHGKFFVKIFRSSRKLNDCTRNVDIIRQVSAAGISIPKLYTSSNGNYLSILPINKSILRLCVMDFIEGKDLFTSKAKINKEDIHSLASLASALNQLNIKPAKIYDSWAIPNFPEEFKKKSKYLNSKELALMKPLLRQFAMLDIPTLPHCFVHGDILRTNIIKDKHNKLWLIDFSVSNYYPRIQELAVLACDVLFNKDNEEESEKNLTLVLNEYQRKIKLNPRELWSLPLYIKIAHAMHLLCATYEQKVNKNNSAENKYFMKIGRAGMRRY